MNSHAHQASASPGATNQRSPESFLSDALECFERAVSAAGLEEREVAFGPIRVRLRFAGAAMVPLVMRALAHVAADSAGLADLTVCFFDNESTGTQMTPPAWGQDDYTGTGEIRGFNNGRIHVTYMPGNDVLNAIDCQQCVAIYWAPSFRLVPWWEQSFPLRPILNWWLKDKPWQPVHAAALGRPDGGVLISGPSGSGKSTTTLACLDSGLLYAGDDYVLVQVAPSPHVFSMYSTAKLEAENISRFPHLEPWVSNAGRLDREKAMLFLFESHREQLSHGFPIRAIVIPQVTGRKDSSIEPLNASAALLALAPTTTQHLPGTRAQTVQKLLQLVKAVPAYSLRAGTDLAQISELIKGLLQKLRC